jgi:hypothetical protein
MPIETTKPIDRSPVLVDLALQGGGAHGAFTWGVLDRLLEEAWLEIDGISGTSAGAMNAAVLIHGHQKGGRAGAREALETFWRRISDAARISPFRRGPLDVMLGRWTLDSSPMYVAMDLMSRLVSPYTMNPMGKNPLREILAEIIDFDLLAKSPNRLKRSPCAGPSHSIRSAKRRPFAQSGAQLGDAIWTVVWSKTGALHSAHAQNFRSERRRRHARRDRRFRIRSSDLEKLEGCRHACIVARSGFTRIEGGCRSGGARSGPWGLRNATRRCDYAGPSADPT